MNPEVRLLKNPPIRCFKDCNRSLVFSSKILSAYCFNLEEISTLSWRFLDRKASLSNKIVTLNFLQLLRRMPRILQYFEGNLYSVFCATTLLDKLAFLSRNIPYKLEISFFCWWFDDFPLCGDPIKLQENLESNHGQPKSGPVPSFKKIVIFKAKLWTLSKDLIDFTPK
jgi:hypothetical protein